MHLTTHPSTCSLAALRKRWRAWVLAMALAALPGAAAAADATPADAGAAPSSAASATVTGSAKPIAPIGVPQIATRADEDERLADRIGRRAAGPDPSARLAAELGAITASVDEMLHAYTPEQMRRLPVMRLESLERHWRFDLRRFARWREDMQLATQPYLDDAATLAQRRADWETTRATLRTHELPAVLGARLDALLQRLVDTEQRLAEPLSSQLELRRRANALEARIQQGQSGVQQAIAHVDRRLLRLDSPPLWAAQGSTDTAASARQGLDIETRFAREYRAADNDRPLVLHALQFVLLPVLLWMASRSRRAAPGEVPADSVRALTRPLSLWVLLAMIAVFVIEPDAPLLVHQGAMVIALIPVLRLLPPEAEQWLDRWPFIATGLFLLARLGLLVLGSEWLYRLFLLALGLLSLMATLWMLYRARPAPAGNTPAWQPGRGLRAAAWTGAALLAVATLANVAGNFSLAETLVLGVTDSAYLSLMLYAGVSVSTALLHWLLDRPAARRFVRVPQRASALAMLLARLLKLLAICGWVLYTMSHLRILRPTYAFVSRVLTADVGIGAISISLGNILVFVIAVLVAFWVARGVRALVHDEVLGRIGVSRGVGNSVASLTYYAVLLAGLLLALSVAGFKVSQLAIVFGALGVGIGFGLQNVVNNFVSGLVLMFERPIEPGDTIEVGTMTGTVSDIGLRATTVRTFDGADVVVPNGTLLSGNLVNWTLRDRSRRIELSLGVGYAADPAQVSALLIATAAQTPGVVQHPAPSAFFTAFGDSALQFSVRAWTFDFDNWYAIRSDLAMRVHRALGEAGIEIPFPQRDLHLRSVSAEAGANAALLMESTMRGPA